MSSILSFKVDSCKFIIPENVSVLSDISSFEVRLVLSRNNVATFPSASTLAVDNAEDSIKEEITRDVDLGEGESSSVSIASSHNVLTSVSPRFSTTPVIDDSDLIPSATRLDGFFLSRRRCVDV